MSKLLDDLQEALNSKIQYGAGAAGDPVAAIQAALLQVGFNCQGIDGIYGQHTKAAVIAFQTAYSIGQTGIVGEQTLTKLIDVVKKSTSPQPTAGHGSGHSNRPMVDVDLRDACPNYASRNGTVIDTIVLHNTEGSLESAEDRFENASEQVSAHLIIDRDGRCAQMVDEGDTAWHSGVRSVNQRSIGIENVAGGGMGTGLTAPQQTTLVAWVKYLMETYGVTIDNIYPHRAIVSTSCPGSIWPTDAEFEAWKHKYLV